MTNLKHIAKHNIPQSKISQKAKLNKDYLRELRNKPTEAEIVLGKYLIERKVFFIFQRGFVVPFHRIVDFYLPGRKVIIEVDGGYHKGVAEKDADKDFRWLLERNKKTVRITNEEVFDGSYKFKLDPFIARQTAWDKKRKSKYPANWNIIN